MRHTPILVLLFALLLPGAAIAQISYGGTPPSLDPVLAPQLASPVPVEVLPAFDLAPLLAEDVANSGRKDIPWRFGHNIPVQLGFDTAGLWETLTDGTRIWRLGIRSEDAVSLNLAFDVFLLPPAAEFFVRSADGATVLGAFTEASNKADGRFATTLVMDDEVVLEYREPAEAPFPGELSILRVTHGYRSAFGEERGLNDSGACNNNVHCSPLSDGWEEQIRSVAMLVTGGSGFCTGSMLNNTASDGTPYLLTANHCYSNPSYWVFWFNWESPDCNNPSSSPPYDSITGASLVARDGSSDFALLELSSAPPEAWNVFLSGWDNLSTTPPEATCIHHPSGDIKKFTVEGSQVSPDGDYWEVGPWDAGTTEGGSSGAPLFNGDHRIVGQLYGGWAACDGSNPNNYTDTYGRFDVSWDGPAPDERLHDWLDPGGTGAEFFDGLDLGVPPPPFDAGVSALTQPDADAWYCSENVPAEVTLTNFGTETLVTVDVQYSVDGGPTALLTWTGALASGADVQVTLPDQVVSGAGSHTFEASASNPNGESDGNPANDSSSMSFDVLGSSGASLPLLQGFEGSAFPPAGWDLADPDGEEAWDRSTAAGGFDLSGASAWFNNFDDDNIGADDWLYTPLLDLSTAVAPLVLEFDVAYTRYDDEYADRLQVMASTDCGQTWDAEYDKESEALQTAPDHDDDFVPEPWEWRRETVALDGYAGETSVRLAFVNTTGWGNHLYVDDMVVHGGPSDLDQDGDGYTTGAGDCDDSDPAIHPGIPEQCDGVDTNCDGSVDDVDADGDDSIAAECGGPDCDDSDASVRPGAVEDCDDGIDNDCDGAIDGADTECGGDDDDAVDDDDVADDDDAATDDDDAVTDDDDTSPKGTGLTGQGDACNCDSAAGSGASPALLLGLVGLVALRRRR